MKFISDLFNRSKSHVIPEPFTYWYRSTDNNRVLGRIIAEKIFRAISAEKFDKLEYFFIDIENLTKINYNSDQSFFHYLLYDADNSGWTHFSEQNENTRLTYDRYMHWIRIDVNPDGRRCIQLTFGNGDSYDS